jgi:protein dpy-30
MMDPGPAAEGTVEGSSKPEVTLPQFSNPEAAKAAEKAAVSTHKKLSTESMPIRQYLEATVVPILMQGMQGLVKERPDNPVEWLAAYLLKHNPQKSEVPPPTA